jgi:Domain of unknown function (DUF4333)
VRGRPRFGSRLIVLALPAVLFAACSKTLDTASLQSALRTDIQRKAHVVIRSVSCPQGLKPARGVTFVCTLTYSDGSKHHVRVTETDDQGRVTYAVTD